MERVLCREVVISTKAYLTIVTETLARVSTETGGILLGRRADDVWYVIEAIDAGMQAIFRPAYFEYDTPYVNHLANHVARLYENRLELLGLWHRHPGSMDTFSTTDNGTNAKYAEQGLHGSISALVNLDPNFRLTMYHVALPLRYMRSPVRWGDEHVPAHFLALKRVDEVLSRLNQHPGASPAGAATSSSTTQPTPTAPSSAPHTLVDSFRNTFRVVSQSLSRRRPETTSVPQAAQIAPSTTSPQPLPEPATSAVQPTQSQAQAAALDILEQELDYLETQRDYKCTMRIQGERVVIDMEYVHAMPYFPPRIECILGIKPDGQQYIIINRDEKPYVAGSIRAYVDQAIYAAMDRRPSEGVS